jgi:hypothetical protein
MALALQVRACDKHLELGNLRKLPLPHFHDYVGGGHVRHPGGKTFQRAGHDKHRFAANSSFQQLVLGDEILRSFWPLDYLIFR